MAKEATQKTEADEQATQLKGRVRLVGDVVSDKMQNTIVVAVTRTGRHPLYKKTIKHTKKYKAHNALGVKTGDRVIIEEVSPISKDKRFIVTKVLEKAMVQAVLKEEVSDLDLLLGVEKDTEPKEEAEEKGEA